MKISKLFSKAKEFFLRKRFFKKDPDNVVVQKNIKVAGHVVGRDLVTTPTKGRKPRPKGRK